MSIGGEINKPLGGGGGVALSTDIEDQSRGIVLWLVALTKLAALALRTRTGPTDHKGGTGNPIPKGYPNSASV